MQLSLKHQWDDRSLYSVSVDFPQRDRRMSESFRFDMLCMMWFDPKFLTSDLLGLSGG